MLQKRKNGLICIQITYFMSLTLEAIRLEEVIQESLPLTPEQRAHLKQLQHSKKYQFWAQIDLWNPEGAERLKSNILFLIRSQIVFALRNFPGSGIFEVFEEGKTLREMINAGRGKKQIWVDADPKFHKVLYTLKETRESLAATKMLSYEEL